MTYDFRVRPALNLSLLQSPGGRKDISPSKSAMMLLQEGHSCSTVHQVNTASKVMARLAFSLNRFVMAFSWECTTYRGKTKYVGGKTRCGQGSCESAHAALSPTLYDNKMELVKQEISSNPFQSIKLNSQNYLKGRFTLTTEHIRRLSNSQEAVRLKCFEELSSLLKRRQKKGSIANSSVELIRNATYSNPRASNRVDCYLERSLRKKEDDLALLCTQNKQSPEEALQNLVDAYKTTLEIAHAHLLEEQQEITKFQNAWNQLIDSMTNVLSNGFKGKNEVAFKKYCEAAKQYLTLYQERINPKLKKNGVSSHKALIDCLRKHHSIYVLKRLDKVVLQSDEEVENWWKSNEKHLLRYLAVEEFNKAHLEITQRLEEIQFQLKELSQDTTDIHAFVKMQCNYQDENGSLKTPTRAILSQKFPVGITPLRTNLGFVNS